MEETVEEVVLIIPIHSGGMKSHAYVAENSRHLRVFCADTGTVINIPTRFNPVMASDSDVLEIICPAEFARENVPAQYICEE